MGAVVTDAMGRQAPEGLLGIPPQRAHAAVALNRRPTAEGVRAGTRGARRAHDVLDRMASAIVLEQSTRPQTIGYALLDSPVGLAAWMLDHDTDSYYKISRAFVDGEPVGNLTREQHRRRHHAVLADGHRCLGRPVVLGVRTGPGRSAVRPARLRRRSRFRSASRRSPARSSLPRAAGSRQVYPDLAYFNEADRGGHFAAWEEPELFSDEMRAAFRSLRTNGGSS